MGVQDWEGLQQELSEDVHRLWLRNLGRDDRLVADHSREARHPFLDEGFMTAVLSLPLHLIADLSLPGAAKFIQTAGVSMMNVQRGAEASMHRQTFIAMNNLWA